MKTHKGIRPTGAHAAASDRSFEAYGAGSEPTDEGLFLYHLCSSLSCGALTRQFAFLPTS